MTKMEFFPLDPEGLARLREFQKENVILSDKQYSVKKGLPPQPENVYNDRPQYEYRGTPHVGVRYVPKTELQPLPEPVQQVGTNDKSTSKRTNDK